MHLLHGCLAWLTDAALANSIVGDLEELRQKRERASAAATLWFWRTALSIVIHVVGEKLRAAFASLRVSRGGASGAGGDMRQALRTLRRHRAFAVSAVLLLALGIGANTLVFSVVHGVVLRPLPYREPDRLVYLWRGTQTNPGNRHSILTGSHVHEFARGTTTLESYAVAMAWDTSINGIVDLVRDEGSDRLRGAFITPNLFELLGVRAAHGRTFVSSDSEGSPVAVISAGLWRRRFGMSPGVLGMQVRLASGRKSRTQPPYTIVGVLPDDVRFTYPRETEIFLLLPWTQIRASRALEYTMVGRLRPGVTHGTAEAELTTITRNIVRTYTNIPEKDLAKLLDETRAMAEPLEQHLAAEVRPGVMLLGAVSGLVLLIACVNLGLLMLARTVDRAGELAVRAALGAGPKRLVRLLTIEGLVLAAIGGIAGVVLAAAVLPVVRRLLPAIVPRGDEITLDVNVLGFALLTTALTALVCGIAPGVLASRRDLLAVLRRTGISSTASRAAVLFRHAVVSLQVATVLVLLVAAGLLLHSFWRLQTVNLGFEPSDLLTLETRLYNPKYRDKDGGATFERALLAHVRGMPGVAQATITTAVPMRGVDFTYVVGPPNGKPQLGQMRSVAPGYFEMMRIPLRAGRLFSDADSAVSAPVMIVSESYGRRHFGAENPVGRLIDLGAKPVEIVGVVGDVRYAEVARDAAPAFYLPRAQSPVELICLLVKPRPGMSDQVADSLRGAVRAIDPEQPFEGLSTVAEIVSQSTADRRFYALATGMFAAIALALAIAGLFGVVSRAVSERRRELAIRTAVGADARRIVRLVLGYGLVPVAIGITAGSLAALAGARLLRNLLFQVPPTDGATYAACILLVLAVAVAACLLPARRALRVEPSSLLRD